jgi:2'-5' RNA ligase
LRSFVALPLPDEAEAFALRVQGGISSGRLSPPENLHVTLAFLDDQPEHALRDLHEDLSRITRPGFDLIPTGPTVLHTKAALILAIEIDASPALLALRKAVLQSVRAVGLPVEARTYRPHITLARLRHGTDGETQAARFLSAGDIKHAPAWGVSEFGLYESRLSADGPSYDALATYDLTYSV